MLFYYYCNEFVILKKKLTNFHIGFRRVIINDLSGISDEKSLSIFRINSAILQLVDYNVPNSYICVFA